MSKLRAAGWMLGASLLAAALLAVPAPAIGQVSSATAVSHPDVIKAVETLLPSLVSVAVQDEWGQAIGSGVVYKPGVVVTNAHVVEGGTKYILVLPDNSTVEVQPENVSYDIQTDLAVIRVPGLTLPAAGWADSDQVQVGQVAVALGNPNTLKLRNTVTVGTVSGKGRGLGGYGPNARFAAGVPLLQTDAPINGGNSGGPLINVKGEVIGINSAGYNGIGIEGLGLAIPSNTVREIADRLLLSGSIERFWLGLAVEEPMPTRFGLPTSAGLKVAGIYQNREGLDQVRVGDTLISVDNHLITTSDRLAAVLNAKSRGSAATLTLRRGSTPYTITLPYAAEPRDPGELRYDPGVMTELNDYQISWADELAWYLSDYTFEELFAGVPFLAQYVQEQGPTRLFFQTEFIYTMMQMHDQYRTMGEVTGEMARMVAGVVHGRIVVTGTGPAGSYRATLKQGSQSWTSQPGPGYPTFIYPPARQAADSQTVFHLQFATGSQLQPMDPVELVLERNGAPVGTFRFLLDQMW